MKAIYITGFMGSGKTTIGKALAKRLHLPVIDTDVEIERQQGKVIRDIFATEGEEVFRQYETDVLQALPTTDVIITTGGGIVGREENRRFMAEHGTVMYLHCEPTHIVQRLQGDTTRPLFQETETFFALFEARQPLYREAAYTIVTTNRAVDAIVEEMVDLIKML